MTDRRDQAFTRDIRWYCRYGISYGDLEEMMAERGVDVDCSRERGGNSAVEHEWPRWSASECSA